MENFLNTSEAGALLEIDPKTVRAHISRGNIAAKKFGRDWLITQTEVERFDDERQKPGRPKKKPNSDG